MSFDRTLRFSGVIHLKTEISFSVYQKTTWINNLTNTIFKNGS